MRTSITMVGLLAGLFGCLDQEAVSRSERLVSSGYSETQYPIVLLPGLLGFDTIIGVVEYFPAITEALSDGGAEVFIASGSKANSSEQRAAQLIPVLEEIAAITGADRLNLIGHSQGSIDARVIAAERPDLVASVTSVGGPHRGATLATLIDGGTLGPIPELLLGGLADLMTLLSGTNDPNDVEAAMHTLSAEGMAKLNARYPAAVPTSQCGQGAAVVDGVPYYSWSGVATMTNPIDLLDTVWVLASLMANERNDGLVGRCSSHLGTVIRDDYPQNHLDQTNMLFGLVSPFGARPSALFRGHANRLRNAGL